MYDEDAPRLLFGRTRRVRASRKAHRCCHCGQMIEVGQPKIQVVMMDDENPRPWMGYSHPACEYAGVEG